MNNFIEQFKKEIENFTPAARATNMGLVMRVGDGVAEIEGLDQKTSDVVLCRAWWVGLHWWGCVSDDAVRRK